jgi:hypothetical protein
MMTLRSLLIGVVTPVLFFLLIPNAEAIKVKRIFRGEKQTLAPQETTFDFEIPTAETLQTLRLLNLDGRLGDNNIAVIAILNGYRRAAPDPQLVAAEAELYFLRAQRLESGFREQAAGWYLLAASRSYEYLVDALGTPSEIAFDLRIVQMNDLYSRAVGAYLRFLREKVGLRSKMVRSCSTRRRGNRCWSLAICW